MLGRFVAVADQQDVSAYGYLSVKGFAGSCATSGNRSARRNVERERLGQNLGWLVVTIDARRNHRASNSRC